MGLECSFWQITVSQLEELMDSDEAVESLICGEDDAIKAKSLYLDKAWHILHFCMTGETEGEVLPLSYAIVTGFPIAENYLDGAVYLLPDDVSDVAGALSKLSEKAIVRRFKEEARGDKDIYRNKWPEDDLEEFMGYFHQLKEFYREAAEKGYAVLRHIG